MTAMDVEDQLRPEAYAVIDRIAFPLWKPPAHVTIDDRAVTFTGLWPSLDDIATFKPWNRSTK